MNQEVKTISRRDFLKSFPRKLMKNIQSLAGSHLLDFSSNQNSDKNQEKAFVESKKAMIDIERCLAWGGLSCQLCYLACPLRDQAMEMVDQKPVVVASFCNGCRECLTACQTVNDTPAIKMGEFSFI